MTAPTNTCTVCGSIYPVDGRYCFSACLVSAAGDVLAEYDDPECYPSTESCEHQIETIRGDVGRGIAHAWFRL